VETAEGLANIGEIAAVEGVDVIFIGPGDLSVSIDALGPEGKEKLDGAIRTITQTALAAGRCVGIFRPSTSDIATWFASGISFYLLASDTMFLGAAMAENAVAARNLCNGQR